MHKINIHPMPGKSPSRDKKSILRVDAECVCIFNRGSLCSWPVGSGLNFTKPGVESFKNGERHPAGTFRSCAFAAITTRNVSEGLSCRVLQVLRV